MTARLDKQNPQVSVLRKPCRYYASRGARSAHDEIIRRADASSELALIAPDVPGEFLICYHDDSIYLIRIALHIDVEKQIGGCFTRLRTSQKS
jgi:hypothetical protein